MGLLINIQHINQEIDHVKSTIECMELADDTVFTETDKDILLENYHRILDKLVSCLNIAIINMEVEFEYA